MTVIALIPACVTSGNFAEKVVQWKFQELAELERRLRTHGGWQ